MEPAKRRFLLLNAVGGAAVLGSYVHGIATHADPGLVWGGVPESLKPLYTVSMFLAAASYFPFTAYLFFQVPADRARVGPFGFGLFQVLYAVVLLGSALWMPLTFRMLEAPGAGLWWLIRLDLLAVGVAAAALLPALARLEPRPSPVWHRLAMIAVVPFTWQTLVLDALVWPAYFPR